MTPYKQRFRHNPDAGIWGDCYRTAVASICDIDPEHVPHFCDKGSTGSQELRDWMGINGLIMFSLAYEGTIDDLPGMMRVIACNNTGMHYLLTGQSRTGCNHVVVCRNEKIVHDPSLDDSGIVGPVVGTSQFIFEFLAGALPKIAAVATPA
jgi:hypothetical protein